MKLDENLFEAYIDYSDKHDFSYQIKQKIDGAVDKIFNEFQASLGIKIGDVSPEHSMELDELEEELAVLIKKIFYFQINYQPDEYDESLNESDEDDEDSDPKYDARYEVNSYYGRNYRGLEDDLYTDDFEEVKEWVWEKIQNGGYIEAIDRKTGGHVRLDPDNYDFESDDAYGVFDDLDSISPLF